MELRDAECFLAIVEHRNFGRAAEALGVAQPPLSRRIAALEEELGARLFSRERRQIELTPSGHAFVREARALLTQAEQARRAVRDAAHGEAGRVRLGFVGSSTYDVVPAALRAFGRSHPRVRVTLTESLGARQIDALHAGTIDVALIRGPIETGDLRHVTLRSDPLGAALPQRHRLAKRRKLAVADLRDEPFIMFNRYGATGVHDVVRGVCAHAGFVPYIVQEVDSIETLFACVAGEMGVALIYDVVSKIPIEGIVHRPIDPVGPAIQLAAVWSPVTSSNRHVAALVATLCEVATCPRDAEFC